jgi:hypothetical protein
MLAMLGRRAPRTRRALLLGALLLAGCASASPVAAPTTTVPTTVPATAVTTAASPSTIGTTTTVPATAPDTTWVPPAALTGNPFAEPVGNWVGGDIPRIYPLPDGREVWWLNDSFVPPDGTPPVDQFQFVRNVLFLRERDGSLQMHLGTRDGDAWDFLEHPDPDHFHRFYWPLGGMVVGDTLQVFVAEMQCDDPQWGICFRPIRTWLATYTWADMQLVDLHPAVNDGVRPVYGFSVVSDEQWTYLYGAGAEYNTPHITGGSDQTSVARVPRGQLDATPTYWDGSGWNPDPASAAVLVQRGYSDFRMSVIPWNGGYLGVAKEDEFVGQRIIVMTAPAPQGPWTDRELIPMPFSNEHPDFVTYDAAPYPQRVDGRLAIVYSTNSTVEATVFRDPSVYRPALLVTDVT